MILNWFWNFLIDMLLQHLKRYEILDGLAIKANLSASGYQTTIGNIPG